MEFHPLLGAALELDKTYRIVIGLKETDGNSMRLRSNLAGAGVCRTLVWRRSRIMAAESAVCLHLAAEPWRDHFLMGTIKDGWHDRLVVPRRKSWL